MAGEIVVIAEKPDLAKAIAEGLGGGSRQDGYIDCGKHYVTWVFGHMLELEAPETPWSMAELPISFIPWSKKPSPDKMKQLRIIRDLLKPAKGIIHAGDPDDEGQLLVDEVIEWAGSRLPVQRVLINDYNLKLVQRALSTMRDNREFAGMSAAAEARGVGDLLYGVNMTRAYTLAAQAKGYQGVLSVGRVQTPILGLVVRRDREFEAHTKGYYYTVTGQFRIGETAFPARYQIVEGDPVDDKGRLSDQAHARAIAAAAHGKPAKVISIATNAKEASPPLPYNLLKLQTDASRKFGMKPDQVKEVTQALREKYRLITYNRSDSEYLSDEQHADAAGVLAAIGETAPMLAAPVKRADPAIKSRAFNTAKVSAHHAIIPTEATADLSKLSDAEQKIYLLIARAYVAQFWPTHQYDQTDIVMEVEGRRFTTRSNITTRPGWTILYKNDAGNEDLAGDEEAIALDLRAIVAGQSGTCTSATADQQETKPKPLYTMATLLTDLTRVAKYVRDDRLRKLLIEKDKDKAGEHGGIGTPATRDGIIATLFDRGFLIEKGKNIISTPQARDFYDALPDQAKYPDMTAIWHEQQRAIADGSKDAQSFVQTLADYVAREVATVKEHGLAIKTDAPPCPNCSKPLRRMKGSKGQFWSCTGYSEGCKFTAEDKAGKPVLTKKEPATVSAMHKCMSCGAGLIRRPSAKKKKAFWWSCSGYPECKQTYFDANGKPDYSKGKAA
ncbi:MAG: DNA topoisomerase III [Paracoccus denitrificans]|uniref:DNA topoisomerase n=1 Tax=Paracoccus denitrificans TaxID=266 RepID=A0A533HYS5_PARDE|nr:MAG: DNA topoisomerase III [Paracoccus denitrificans]